VPWPAADAVAHVSRGAVAQPAVARRAGLAFRGRDGHRLGEPQLDVRFGTQPAPGRVAAPVVVGRRVRPVTGVHRHGFDGRPEADHRQDAHVARGTAQLGQPSNVIYTIYSSYYYHFNILISLSLF